MKIIIVSGVNPLRAYSGLKYLAKALSEKQMDVELIAKIPRDMLWETKEWKIRIKSFYTSWYGVVPLLRRYLIYIHIFFLGLFTDSVMVFHELTYFRIMVILKKIRPRKKFIHYCTELYTDQDEPSHKKLLEFYKKHANEPDLIIECDEGREILRKEMYGITKPTVVIPNTVPKSEIPPKASKGSLASLAGLSEIPFDLPIVVYTGGAFFHRQLDMIADAISKMSKKVFFLAFCYGDNAAISELEKICNEMMGQQYCKICKEVPRLDLLECLNEASVGIVYYKPSLSIGNLYASPTKLYEYIGAGVPVISSNNPRLVAMINKYNLGECVADESVSALTDAISNVVFDEKRVLEIKKCQSTIFNDILCYEVAADKAIKEIVELVRS